MHNRSILLFLAFLSLIFTSCSYTNEVDLYPCDTLNVSYSQTIAPIIEQRCFACHSSANAALYGDGWVLEGHSNIFGAKDDVVENIKHLPGSVPMPKGGPKLSDCEIAKIEAWVNKGAPND